MGYHGDQRDPQELVCGWQCQGIVKGRERGKEEGGRALKRPWERDLLANRVKHRVIQAPVIEGSGQEGKGMERGEAEHEWREGLWAVKRQ